MTLGTPLAALASPHRGYLDFNRQGPLAYPCQLFLMPGCKAVHTDKIGNEAWGYYARTKLGMAMVEALYDAQMYTIVKDGVEDDPMDQDMI